MSENEVLVENEEVINLDTILDEVEVDKVEDEIITEEIKEVKNNNFGNGILVGVVDQIVVFAGALAIQLVFGLLLKLFGYHIVEQDKMLIIIYAIANIIYLPVCKKLKLEKTLGSKVVLKK